MPDDLQNNPWFQLALVVVLAILLVVAGRKYYPNTEEMEVRISALTDQVGALQRVVSEGRQLEKKLPELRREIREKEKQLEQLKQVIPTAREAEELIRRIERMAGETNITLVDFLPSGQQAKEFYSEWPIRVRATGNYHNLGKFFSKISNYQRIINVQGVQISVNAQGGSESSISAAFTAVTYVYKEGA